MRIRKDAVGYLLTAMVEGVCFVARDQLPDYGAFASFAKIAGRINDLLNIVDADEEYLSVATKRKVKVFLLKNFFGIDEWYRILLNQIFQEKPIKLDEFQLEEKAEFDRRYPEIFEGNVVPENLSG